MEMIERRYVSEAGSVWKLDLNGFIFKKGLEEGWWSCLVHLRMEGKFQVFILEKHTEVLLTSQLYGPFQVCPSEPEVSG